jgi:hypothetical protein
MAILAPALTPLARNVCGVADRPRDRTTILIGVLTIVAMAIVATIFLVISSPWNDPHPRFHPKPAHTHSARRG